MAARFAASDPGSKEGVAGDKLRGKASLAASNFGATAADNQTCPSDHIETEFQHYNFLLIQLLNIISHGEDEDVSRMISVIRSGASHRQIFDFIKQQPRQPNETK
ncbi:hypothetical protein N7509_000067 [Penicillium cosmopolitanum]|uniref:Uncharacterized protein n=1 Tax=Penicillium cosmopolitanum TaxID=1131564 RepID=A0A9W9WCK6_9EURO|nr:uncharacterized protein N7509_000067 [Penicillium cosmopolitanum]KAJ5414969.1 hypothetical protein N7509_000067 [Penicillium cosmopolitanum]